MSASAGYVRPNPVELQATSESVPAANGHSAPWTQAEATLPPPATANEHLSRYESDPAFPRQSYTVREFTYIMQCDPGTPIKIGRAKQPLKRLATFQTSQAATVYLLYVIPGGREMETSLHYCMRESRIRGEWFKCDRDFLIWAHDFAELALYTWLSTSELLEPPVAPPEPKQAKRLHYSKRHKAKCHAR